MTREEAIFMLEETVKNACWPMYQDALDMAISALKEEPLSHEEAWGQIETHDIRTETHECVKETHDSDLISRADALEEMAQAECGCSYEVCKRDKCDCSYIGRIKDIPSATPYQPYTDIEPIKDDRPKGLYHGTLDVQSGVLTINEPSDLISREDAVNEIKHWFEIIRLNPDILIDNIKTLPSADRPNDAIDHDKEWIIGCIQHDGFIHTHRFDKANQIILDALADRPSGEWLQIDMDLSGFFYQGYYCSECNHVYKLKCNFCPNCGARMEGGNE